MRPALATYLLNVQMLLKDKGRDRGARPGPLLEVDLEKIAHAGWLPVERRVHHAPFQGVYFSGLKPETDLFVYDGPQFLHVECKDLAGGITRAILTEFWGRALDLHMGRGAYTLPEAIKDHFPVLVVASEASDQLRAACIRWSITLIEPSRIPLPVLNFEVSKLTHLFEGTACIERDLRWASLPFNQRNPRGDDGILLPIGRERTRWRLEGLLRFQQNASNQFDWSIGRLLDECGRQRPRKGMGMGMSSI